MNRRHPKVYGHYSRLQRWLKEDGWPGQRYTPADISRFTLIPAKTIVSWIDKGWLRASRTTSGGYRIKRRSIRRLFADHPMPTYKAAIKGQLKVIREYRAKHGLSELKVKVMRKPAAKTDEDKRDDEGSGE